VDDRKSCFAPNTPPLYAKDTKHLIHFAPNGNIQRSSQRWHRPVWSNYVWPTGHFTRRDNSRATSNIMMYKTTDSQHLKLKKENNWVHHGKLVNKSKQQFIYSISLYHWDTCGRGFSDKIVPLSIAVLVVQVGDCHPMFLLPFDFSFQIWSASS